MRLEGWRSNLSAPLPGARRIVSIAPSNTEILHALGLELTNVPDAHLCCGSAGTYSILQPKLSNALRTRKLAALESGKPEVIASANIGCMMHLAAGATVDVRHWIELLDSRMVGGPRSPA